MIMRLIIRISGLLLCLTCSYIVQAQVTFTDCIGATPVCNNIYQENIVPTDEGLFPNEINPEISCIQNELNNIWYSFTVNRTGKFGFIIKPNDAAADYDWSMYNLTNASCADIFSDASILVSCNSAGSSACSGDTGATGESSFSKQGGNCGAALPDNEFGRTPFNDLIDVVEGNSYVLTVSNFDRGQAGYTIDFSLSDDIGIIDNLNPSLTQLDVVEGCAVSELDILFSENIKCNTIDIENITIDGDVSNIMNISSEICAQGGASDKRYKILLSTPISISGAYELAITPSGPKPISDLCDNSTGDITRSFQVVNEGIAPALIDVVPDDPCQINSVTINFSQNMLCMGVAANSFTVSGPNGFISGQTILENCESSSSFVFEFAQPLLENAVYQVFINRIPGIALTNECSIPLGGDIMTEFTKESEMGGAIETVDWNSDCAISELLISFDQAIVCSSIRSDNLSVVSMGNIITGTIVDSDCNDNSPMTLSEVTFQLDEAISINGAYNVSLTTNGVDEVLTVCGSPSMSGTEEIMVNLMLEVPQITDVTFPDSCNIQTMTLLFSKEVQCQSAQNAVMNLTFGGQDIDVRPINNNCELSQSIEVELGSVINADGEYIFDFVENAGAFTDVCDMGAESANIVGALTFSDCDSCFVYVPNAFSPNGDSVNDSLGPLSNCGFDSVTMIVFDRWGNMVYEETGTTISWDGLFSGDKIEPGVYAYIIDIELREFRKSSTRTRKGTFTVM